jgi:hypothetical protein
MVEFAVTTASTTARSSSGIVRRQLLAVDQLQLRGINELRERVSVGFEDEDVPLEQPPVSGRNVAPVTLANDGRDGDVAIAKRLEVPHRLADVGRGRRQADLLVVLDGEAGSGVAPAPLLMVGRSRQPKARKVTPTRLPSPTGAKSNMRNGSPVICSRMRRSRWARCRSG